MRWTVARRLRTCGYCNGSIRPDEPMQILEAPEMPARVRCEAHATGPVDEAAVAAERQLIAEQKPSPPSPMPRLPAYAVPGDGVTRVKEFASLPEFYDPKAKAAGE